jgi:hypothetical protein
MNLNYIRNYLETKKENITVADIEELIKEIDTYQGTENKFLDISAVMKTINDYNLTYLSQVQQYEGYSTEDIRQLPKRSERVRAILCTLSALHTFLVLSMSNITKSNFNMGNLTNYMRDLESKKEHFKSEKMTWAAILRSLTQEMAFTADMRKLDIEDKIGYIKYKDN